MKKLASLIAVAALSAGFAATITRGRRVRARQQRVAKVKPLLLTPAGA